MAVSNNSKLNVFVSYSHKDSRWLERLQVHLKPLRRDYRIDLWDDTRIRAGTKWQREIEAALKSATAAILIISADFLASDFIYNDELPPLLKSAEEDGLLILPIIASPSLFSTYPSLSQFQAVNPLSKPLISASEGEQEAVFLKVAQELLLHSQGPSDRAPQSVAEEGVHRKEAFLEHATWTRLIKIGDWIYDEEQGRIIGSGMGSYLLSREEYGEEPFVLRARVEFTNFQPPQPKRLGMNAGLVFGWKIEKGVNRYYNVLLTGSELLLERVGFKGASEGQDSEHISNPSPLEILPATPYEFELRVADRIEIRVDGKQLQTLARRPGITGRVGLRPWRSNMDCTMFVAERNAK